MTDRPASMRPAAARPAVLCIAQRHTRALMIVACLALVGAVSALAPASRAQSGAKSGAQVGAPSGPQSGAQVTQPGYTGVWFDDTGEGAVEIGSCADRLCGRIVWLRAPLDKSGRPLTDAFNPDARQRQRPICGLPVIGDLKRQRNGSWDEGWIYDPKQGKQFDVELRLRSPDALQVMGYLGVKFLSETFVWRRAPADLKRCA
jgi:uncharacterized protein (DUF2147 family)